MVNRHRLGPQRVTGKTFELVDTTSLEHQLRRHPDGGTLWASGRFVMNTNGSDLWHAVVRATEGIDQTKYVARGGGDPDKLLIAVYAVDPGTAGGTAVRLSPRKKASGQFNVTLKLHDVFIKYPELRFTGKRKVSVAGDWDSAGRPYLEIQLQTQLTTKTISRKGTGQSSGQSSGTKSGKQAPPPAPDLAPEDELASEEE
ncbi:MAG: hypothetical protein K0R39_4451 [Symbiobacteriaceae bacterium]|jgi:hypothetical protein|nr:hypothetical protein [Symbiobacteriaceae bacterium]